MPAGAIYLTWVDSACLPGILLPFCRFCLGLPLDFCYRSVTAWNLGRYLPACRSFCWVCVSAAPAAVSGTACHAYGLPLDSAEQIFCRFVLPFLPPACLIDYSYGSAWVCRFVSACLPASCGAFSACLRVCLPAAWITVSAACLLGLPACLLPGVSACLRAPACLPFTLPARYLGSAWCLPAFWVTAGRWEPACLRLVL